MMSIDVFVGEVHVHVFGHVDSSKDAVNSILVEELMGHSELSGIKTSEHEYQSKEIGETRKSKFI